MPSKYRYLNELNLSEANKFSQKILDPINVDSLSEIIREQKKIYKEYTSDDNNVIGSIIELLKEIIEKDGYKLWLKNYNLDIYYMSAQIYQIYLRALTTKSEDIELALKESETMTYELNGDSAKKLPNHYIKN